MFGNALPMTSHLIFQLPESGQFAQKTKITNLLGHALYALAQIPLEMFQPSALMVARLTQQFMENSFGIRKIFEPPQIRHGQGLATRWISGSYSQGELVNEQPCFLHSHRNDADDQQDLSSLAPFQSLANFFRTLLH